MNGTVLGGGGGGLRGERSRPRLHSGDVFTLLSSRPETNPTVSIKKTSNRENVSEWIREQEEHFTEWINGHLKSSQHQTSIPDLKDSLKDGLILIELMKVVAPQSIQFIRYHKTPRLRLLKLENIQIAFDCMKREGLQLLNIEPADIVDGNLKLTLGLLQQLANHYPLVTNSKGTSPKAILSWLQVFLPEANINDLSSCWKDGIVLSLLVDKLTNGVAMVTRPDSLDPNNAIYNIEQAMTLASECFQIPKVISPHDMAQGNEESILNYLAYFCVGPDSPGHQYIIDWINKTIPEHSVINFTSDWSDGLALSSLVNTFLPGTTSLEDEIPSLERVKYVMKAAQEELSIEPLIDSHSFISKDTDGVYKMAYISQFLYKSSPSPSPPLVQDHQTTLLNIVGIQDDVTAVQCSSSSEEVAPVAPTSESTFSSDFTENTVPDSSIGTFETPPESPGKVHEKFELPISNKVSLNEESALPVKDVVTESYKERRARESRQSEIDDLFNELDFDLVMKEIDDIGKKDSTTTTNRTYNKQNSNEVNAISSGTSLKSSQQDLELDFDFSSDGEGGTSSSCQSPLPPPPQEKQEMKQDDNKEMDVIIKDMIDSPKEDLKLMSSLLKEGELHFEKEEKEEAVNNDDQKEEEEEEEFIEVSYHHSGISTTASPEPHSEYTTTRTPTPDLSPSPFPGQEEEKEEEEREEERQEEREEEEEEKEEIGEQGESEKEEREEEEEEEITRTPARSSLCYPDKCKVDENSLQCGIVNHPVTFIVDCSSAGRGRLEVIIEDPNGENLEADGAQLKTNVFRINFTPQSVGAHKISVLFGECDVPNSPFQCNVSDPMACTASGPGIDKNIPSIGKEMTFIVDTLKAGPGSLQTTFSGERQPANFKLSSCSFGIYSYKYLITIPGEYCIDIKFAGHHIRGSPFQIIVPKPLPFRPDACTILEHPLERCHVGKEIKIKVDASLAGYGELKAILVNQIADYTCTVMEGDNKIYTVTTSPEIIGKHSIVLQFGGEEIPQSPVIIYVNNPKLVIVDKSICKEEPLPVGKLFSLPINTKNCGEGILSVKVATSAGIDYARVQRKDNNNYIANYTPSTPGAYSIEIFYDNMPCLESPININVSHQKIIDDITLVKTLPVKGNCFHLNKMVEFHVHAPNCEPNKLKLTAIGSQNENKPYTNISPNGNDKYTLQLRATRSDDYMISITYDGLHLNGSPFNVPIRSPPKPHKVAMYDPVIPISSLQALELVFDVSLAGKGSFSASSVNSKGCTMPVYVEQVNNELYRVSFIPRTSDTFLVTVLYADKHINGSPFRVLYKEQEKTPPVCINFEPGDMNVKGLMGAAVHGRNCGRQEATVVQYERGKYQVSFYPSQPDVFDLHIYWFDSEIEGSPFEIDLLGIDNESSESLVDSIPYCGGEEKVGMIAATAAGREMGPLPVHLSLEGEGEETSCVVKFTAPVESDIFDVNLFWNGKPLKGMPVKVQL